MLLRQGTVADFRLNSQCSSGNGAFLQGVAERYNVPLEALRGARVPGEGDAERSRWAAACSSSPTSSTSSARAGRPRRSWPRSPPCCRSTCGSTRASSRTCARSGRKFVLQGGTHRNMAVVKAQVDFIRGKVPEAEVVAPSLLGRGGRDRRRALRRRLRRAAGAPREFRGFDAIDALTYTSARRARRRSASGARSTARGRSSTCSCPARSGRPWSKLPLAPGWERVISGNSCPKGLVEDANEMREVKAQAGGGQA